MHPKYWTGAALATEFYCLSFFDINLFYIRVGFILLQNCQFKHLIVMRSNKNTDSESIKDGNDEK